MFLLHYQLGVSALIGAVLCVAVMTPLQFAIGKKMSANSKSISVRTILFIAERSTVRTMSYLAMYAGSKRRTITPNQ